MKSYNTILVAFLSISVPLAISAQSTSVSKGPSPNARCLTCDPFGGGGGGNGGGNSPNYTLAFGSSQNLGSGVGGTAGRETPAAASGFPGTSINNVVAYTAQNQPIGDQYGDQYVYFRDIASGSNQLISVSNGQAFSDANPALVSAYAPAISPQTVLFMALNSSQNPSNNYGGFTTVYLSTQENQWSVTANQPQSTPNFPATSYSPSLAVSPNYLFTGVRNAADNTLTLCATDITVASGATTCTNFPGTRAMNFNPSLAYWNGTLYIGFEEYDNTHALRMFTSTDNGQTISENTNITNTNGDTTSTEPSLLVTMQNGNVPPTMYVGFRSNDSGHNFLWKDSTDGVNYSTSTNTGIQMTSRPVLVQGVGTYAAYITAFYSSNDSNYNLEQVTGTF